jgi:hypothetical protein
VRQAHEHTKDAGATLGSQSGALAKMERQILDARLSRVDGTKPFLAQGVGVMNKP